MPQRRTRTLVTSLAVGVAALAAPLAGLGGTAAAKTAARHTIVLTNASNGTTVVAVKGDRVEVKLSSDHTLRWSEASVTPTSSTAAPVLTKTGGHQSSNGSSVTTFLVVGYGDATLEATGRPICRTVCPDYILLWQASVEVPVLDPRGAS